VAVRDTAPVTGRHFDVPESDDESEPYWQAAADGRLRLRRCRACTRVHHYPRPFCPHCWSDDVEWIDATGRATLYTYSVVHRNDLPPFGDRVPYVAAVVDLEEGPRVVTEVVGSDPGELHIGMNLAATFRPLDAGPDAGSVDEPVAVVVFEPAAR
jgi:uncharacterized OB-fold protein